MPARIHARSLRHGRWAGRRDHPERSRGQALVEFALVFPIFFTLILGVIEFAFVFNALLSVNYAARDAALAAAEAGDTPGADCVILQAVESAMEPPTDKARIQTVEIYEADANGNQIGTPTTYMRSSSTSCSFIDGTTASVPYNRTGNGYPEANRCNILGGCDPLLTDSVDNIAVRITYTHVWVTPLRNFVGGNPGGLTFDRSSVMRMEPIL
jgi:Flp pilus assembly protein TadG